MTERASLEAMDNVLSDFWVSVAEQRFKSIEDSHPGSSADCMSQSARLRALEEDIEALARMRYLFIRHRNAQLSINCLPSEVLARIFWFVPSKSAPSRGEQYVLPKHSLSCCSHLPTLEVPDMKPIIMITHVCWQWRSVVLAHGALWADIDLARLKANYIRSILSRSAAHMLHIKAINYKQDKFPISEFGSCDLSRIQSLDVECSALELSELFQPSNFSALKFLTATNVDPTEDRSKELFSPSCPVALPDDMRTLTLCDFAISWTDFPRFTQLTHLALSACCLNTGDSGYPSLTRMVDILQRLPHLEVLCLVNIFSSSPVHSALTDVEPTISLPQLATLHLKGVGDTYIHLLDALDVPPTVSIDIDSRSGSMVDFDILLPKCRAILGHLFRFRFWYMQNDYGDFATLEFCNTHQFDQEEHRPNITVSLGDLWAVRDLLSSKIHEHIPFNEVAHLCIDTNTHQFIRDIFLACQSVTHLKVSGSALDVAVSVLAEMPADLCNAGSSSTKQLPTFPVLRYLSLDHVPDNAATLNALTEALRKRHESGAGLQGLHISSRRFSISEEQRNILQHYVNNPIEFCFC